MGRHHGREGIAAVFQKEAPFLDAPPEFEDHDDLGSDHHAVGLLVQRLRRGGRTLEGRQTIIAHVRDGKFSEVGFQPEDQAAFDEFFSWSAPRRRAASWWHALGTSRRRQGRTRPVDLYA